MVQDLVPLRVRTAPFPIAEKLTARQVDIAHLAMGRAEVAKLDLQHLASHTLEGVEVLGRPERLMLLVRMMSSHQREWAVAVYH